MRHLPAARALAARAASGALVGVLAGVLAGGAGVAVAVADEVSDALAAEALERYGAGDNEGAADTFARALDSSDELSAAERNALRFGQATAATRAGRFGEALSLYDTILAEDPGYADAAHNRDIARALEALEAREPRPSDDEDVGEGPSDAPSDEAPEEAAGEEAEQPGSGRRSGPDGEPDPAGEAGRREGEEGEGARAGTEASGGEPAEPDTDASGREADAREAREALAAEEAREREASGSEEAASAREGAGEADGEAAMDEAAEDAEAFDEARQLSDQWLRRIPDDPSALLRARLLQTHRDDYPGVGDGDEPW